MNNLVIKRCLMEVSVIRKLIIVLNLVLFLNLMYTGLDRLSYYEPIEQYAVLHLWLDTHHLENDVKIDLHCRNTFTRGSNGRVYARTLDTLFVHPP